MKKPSFGKEFYYEQSIVAFTSPYVLQLLLPTHLLESGTDIRYIQELLGHKNLKTTEIYTYVSTKSLGKIRSPLDEMNLKEVTEIAHEEN